VAGLTAQLEAINDQLKEMRDKQDKQADTLTRMEGLIAAANEENAKLKVENTKVREEVTWLKERVNNLEQRNRADCVRVFDMPIEGDPTDNNSVAGQVYQKALLPILRGAVAKNRLAAVPAMEEVIENAHVLPGNREHKPIICRFKKNYMKVLVLQLKKEYAARAPPRGNRPAPYLYPIYEDVTRDTYTLMKKLAADERVQASWITGGIIRYKLVGSEDVRKIIRVFAPFDDHFTD